MNRQFMVKMMQAKRLEYEALKEILPEKVVDRIGSLEKELLEFGKEYFMTVMCDTPKAEPTTPSNTKSRARKVTIE